MNIEKIKNYSTTNYLDKYQNPIGLKDIVITGSKRLGIILSLLEDDGKIMVGLTDGTVSKVFPQCVIRIDPLIKSLQSSFDMLSTKANAYLQFARKEYVEYVIDIHDFVYKRLDQKRFEKRLLEDDFHDELKAECRERFMTAYKLNDIFYKEKDLQSTKISIDTGPYLEGSCICMNLIDWRIKAFNFYIKDINRLVLEYFNKEKAKHV